jgi:RNAse (barnase) inhibitor barstar
VERFRIDGAAIASIDDLYDQLNDLLMAEEDWRMGASLDALNDVLYRFEDASEPAATFVWADHEHSRQALGVAATREWLQGKLGRPGVFDGERIRGQLAALEAGSGRTYFDLVVEVFTGHPGVRLELR